MKVGLSSAQHKRFQEMLLKSSGIVLKENQSYLIENRLAVILRELKVDSFDDILDRLPTSPLLNEQIVDLMTTNETLWFRDTSCWDTVGKVCLPALEAKLKAGARNVNIWSAASSTGQEAYSLSIMIHEYLANHFKNQLLPAFNILGTDISKTVVKKAALGEYDPFSLSRGMSPDKQAKYFINQGEKFAIIEEMKKMVTFKNFNLLDSFATLGKFDLILCRNVLIYFSDETKEDILNRMAMALNPGGIIVLGATESTYGLKVNLKSQTSGAGLYLTAI